MIEYRSGGRRVSQKQFFDGIKGKMSDTAMSAMEERVHSAAPSIVDSETGRHAEPRRFNSAIQYLEAVKAVSVYRTLNSGPWAVRQVNTNERTLKFVRNRS